MAPQPVLQLVRTDIAGFVGMAERGPLPEDFPALGFDSSQVALKIGKWGEFLTHFGGFQAAGYLAYAVRAFFENGGDTCYVVRVATTTSNDPSLNATAASFSVPAGAAVPIGTIGALTGPFQCTLTAAAPPVAASAVAVATTATVATSTASAAAAPAAVVPVAANVGDLLLFSGGGFTQLTHVAAVLANGQVQLATALNPQLAVGASVTRFPAACRLCAASRGQWGNALRIEITPLDAMSFSLRATVDLGPTLAPLEIEYYPSLTLANPACYNYAPAVLAQQSTLIRLTVAGGGAIDLTAAAALEGGVFYLQGGRDGLSAITLADFSGGSTDLRGLRLLEDIEDVSILALPDAVFQVPDPLAALPPRVDPCAPPVAAAPTARAPSDPTAVVKPLTPEQGVQLQQLMIEQCARLQYRVAVLDPPDGLQVAQAQTWAAAQGLIDSPASRFAALYYPWLDAPDGLLNDALRRMPPSGYAVGTYAQTDLTYGVQRPPANLELQYVVDVAEPISDLQQQGLNLNYVNAIRAFPGRGIRVWGARSLASRGDEDWRFIHVRRLMSAIEETAQRFSRWVVFQNNDRALRSSLTHSLTVLLEGIWLKGGLQGTKPADAFYVLCDATNNPQSVIDQGQLICEIGVAIAAPMEFLVFEIRQDAAGAQVLEN